MGEDVKKPKPKPAHGVSVAVPLPDIAAIRAEVEAKMGKNLPSAKDGS